MPLGRAARVRVASFLLILAGLPTRADEPEPWLRVRLVQPDELGRRLIALFEGARAPHPAAALAAWTHAAGGKHLSKPVEAAIAALNPEMMRELRALDGAEIELAFARDNGPTPWQARVPNDDGTLAALVTALALTDGAPIAAVGDVAAYRLGPPGAPAAACRPGLLALANDPASLAVALKPPRADSSPWLFPLEAPACLFRIDPLGLRSSHSLPVRRAAAALDATGCARLDGCVSLDGETLTVSLRSLMDVNQADFPGVEPSWLAAFPVEATLGALAVAVGGPDGGPDLASAFALLDRVEKVDPARAGVAPSRTRLNLLATAARVRLEADVWPVLRGVSAAVLVEDDGHIRGALVGLHLSDTVATHRLAGDVLPRLAAAYLRNPLPPPGADPSRPRRLGTVEGRVLDVTAAGRSVWVGWGEGVLERGLAVLDAPGRSLATAVAGTWGRTPWRRAGLFWPGRLAKVAPPGSALAKALAGSSPMIWTGRREGRTARDDLSWTGLRGVVRRGLEALPLDPPPDRSKP